MSEHLSHSTHSSETASLLHQALSAVPFVPTSLSSPAAFKERGGLSKDISDAPCISREEVRELASKGNIFAKTILKSSGEAVMEENTGVLGEKCWYFKDYNTEVQGPFSTFDMLKWSLSGFLSGNLEIGFKDKNALRPLQDLKEGRILGIKEENRLESRGEGGEEKKEEKNDGVYEIKFVSKRSTEL